MPGVKLATAYYELIPSMAGSQAAITSQMGAAGATGGKAFSSKFGGSLGGLKTIGAAAAAAATVGFVKGAIAEAREAQKVGALTASIIKSTGGAANITAAQVGKLATAISKKTGFDDEAIQSGQNLLLTFKNVQNQVGAGNDIFNQATAAAVDLASTPFFNGNVEGASKQLGKALNDPVKGVSALGRAGVTFTQGQKDQIEAMVKSGNVLGAQKIILGEVKSEVGGAAAAQKTAADTMSVSWGNLQETIVAKLTPALDILMGGLTKVFNFIGAHQSVMIAIGVVIGVILVAALVAATVAVWAFTVALLANPIVWIIIGIIALIAAIVLLITHWDQVKAAVGAAWDWIKEKTAAVWGAIVDWLADKWGAIKDKAAEIWDGIKQKLSDVWETIKTTVSTKIDQVVTFIKELPGKIRGAVSDAATWLLGVGEDIINGLIKGIGNGFAWVKQKITELGGNVIQWAREILHIGSPSRIFMEIGYNVSKGMALGIEAGDSQVRTALRSITPTALSSANLAAIAAPAAASDGAPRKLYLETGALEIIGGKAYVTGVLHEELLAVGP